MAIDAVGQVRGVEISEVAVAELRTRLRGELIVPGDDGYDTARRVWNGMIDRRPALIARCAGAADVIQAVNFAREHDLLMAVRGGGHNVAGKAVCDDGLVVDLSGMKSIRVDPATRTARAEPGLLWGELDRETQALGLATTGGVVSDTGIAGLTLGGGEGWLKGRFGLTCDNLLSADVVTADGRLLKASATENPDLFWALRGGGGNFGIVTSFEYRLHPVGPTVLGGMVIHPLDRAGDVLRFYREFTASAPDELIVYAGLMTSPDGHPVIALPLCYSGDDLAEGERLVEPIRTFGPPLADLIRPMAYTEVQTMFDAAFPPGQLHYWKSGLMEGLSDDAIDTIVEFSARVTSPLTAVMLVDIHGMVNRISPAASAYAHRSASYDLIIVSVWTDPAESERHIGWTREFYEAIRPHFRSGVYVNLIDQDEGAERVRAAYGVNYDRLVTVKNRYDPTNFLRVNQNINPTGTGAGR